MNPKHRKNRHGNGTVSSRVSGDSQERDNKIPKKKRLLSALKKVNHDDNGSHRDRKKQKRSVGKKQEGTKRSSSQPQDGRSVSRHEKHSRGSLLAEDLPKQAKSPLPAPLDMSKYTPLQHPPLPFDYKYILAPMVGASELPFRLLCRKYGAQLAYTPMMTASRFAAEEDYRKEIFQTTSFDRPLVCHFGCNSPQDFANCVKLVEGQCDAVDLNLGCPQRTAYVGHFGSYLLDAQDRKLVLDIVRAGAQTVSPPMPIFVKIRLLNTLEETIEFCQQLVLAGASLIAIHARHRASWERTAAGARDGPAKLDQVEEIKKVVTEIPVIANGNVITYEDVEKNLKSTKADGIMSAEGILDDPALFLPAVGDESDGDKLVSVVDALANDDTTPEDDATADDNNVDKKLEKKKRKLLKKLRKIEKIQSKVDKEGEGSIDEDQRAKLASKNELIEESLRIMKEAERRKPPATKTSSQSTKLSPSQVQISQLYESASDKIKLAKEYLALAQKYGPTTIRTIIFHTRRILKTELNKYQLMEDCLQCTDEAQVLQVIEKCQTYRDNPASFIYDREKAKQEKEALERKKREEGKRKAYEARMIRKAKREGLRLDHYLQVGAAVPTLETIAHLKPLSKQEQLVTWKKDHSQHCLAYHLDSNGCQRGRTCAFLHVDAIGADQTDTTFEESEEVAG